MRSSRLLLSLAATSALLGASAFSVSPVSAQDAAPAAEAKAPEFDASVFDVPEGKDEAFYKARLTKINEALALFRQTNPDAAALNEVFLKRNNAMMTCFKHMSEIAELDAAVRARYFNQYVEGLFFFRNLEELQALLAAEEAKETPDASRLTQLKFSVVGVALNKAVEANDEAEIKKLATDLIEKGKTDDAWASRAPALFEDLARSKPALGVPFLKEICAAYAASDDANRQRIAERFEGKIRFAELVGNEMKVEGLYLDGTEIDWASYRGKVVLVDFWATWCGPCVGEIPNMTKMYEKYNAAGFEILGYSIDDDLERLRKFEEDRKLPWKTASRKLTQDAEKDYVIVSSYYGVTSIPTMVLVGKDGKVLSTKARGEELVRLLGEQFPEVK